MIDCYQFLQLQEASENVEKVEDSKVEGNGDKEERELPKENGEEAGDSTNSDVKHA